MLYIISNHLVIFVSNYNYLIHLFRNNFGLAPKIFEELTSFINNEIQKLIKLLIFSNIHEYIVNGEVNEFLSMLNTIKDIYKSTFDFDYIDIFKGFIISFYDKKTIELNDKLQSEDWSQYKPIERKYQLLFDKVIALSLDDNNTNINTNSNTNSTNATNTDTITETNTPHIQNEEIKAESESLIIKGTKKQKAIKFTIDIIVFLFNNTELYSTIENDSIKNELITQLYSLCFELIEKSYNIIMNNQNSNKTNSKIITDKEINTYCSHSIIFKQLLMPFLSKNPNDKINDFFNKTISNCKEIITQLLNGLKDEIIDAFTAMNFENFPIFSEKDYNSYIKKFSGMKKMYDIMVDSFSKEDIIDIYNKVFKELFTKMNDFVKEKKIKIEAEGQLKQFGNVMNYIKKVLKLFELINTDEYIEKIKDISKYVNPVKTIKNKGQISE